jgi:hypothetical protein
VQQGDGRMEDTLAEARRSSGEEGSAGSVPL